MDPRAAKLALARKKLKDHQEKKLVTIQKNEIMEIPNNYSEPILICEEESDLLINDSNAEPVEHVKDIQMLETTDVNLNVTELLISNKMNLEMEISELKSKLSQLEQNQTQLLNENHLYKQQITALESQLKNINDKYIRATEECISNNKVMNELNTAKLSLLDENNNLQEQLEFTKTILTTKESENSSLRNQLSKLQSQLDVTQLQLQQITNGPQAFVSQKSNAEQHSEIFVQKLSVMEQQLKMLQKEKDQMNLHYEHYVSQLNEQFKSVVNKNEKLEKELEISSIRENSLVDQISDIEIRLQNSRIKHDTVSEKENNSSLNEMKQNYENIQAKFQELSVKYNGLQEMYAESEKKIKELSEVRETELSKENLSILKLNADITSDKVAVQKATEQNKKLKIDMQELEEAFVKISRDKLELTEKLDAEKFLNRELTIKLAEIEEKASDMYTKLIAKDEEMIRLQTSYREIKKSLENISSVQEDENVHPEIIDVHKDSEDCETELKTDVMGCEHKCEFDGTGIPNDRLKANSTRIQKEDAMLKLQDRFLKIMEEVADLSDEKHRLEHIILQLQNETDTICEYVALYQQQRSLLKRRDEERNSQLKLFQSECESLKNQLEELSDILMKFIKDKELLKYFQVASRQSDITKIMNLLSNLKNNSIIDYKRKCTELKDFYPCSCCSGKLIDL